MLLWVLVGLLCLTCCRAALLEVPVTIDGATHNVRFGTYDDALTIAKLFGSKHGLAQRNVNQIAEHVSTVQARNIVGRLRKLS